MLELINISALSVYLECLKGFQVSPRHLLDECDIDYQMLIQQEGYINFTQFAKLLELTAKKTQCSHFGLLMSQKQNLSILGILGLLMETSPDIRSAFRELVRYFHTHTQSAAIELVEEGQVAMIIYRVLSSCSATAQVVELSIGTACRSLRLLTGRNAKPRAIYLSHDKISDIDIYNRILNAPVTFNHELNAIVFDRHLLDKRLQGHNQVIQRLLKSNLESNSREFEKDIVGNVRKLLASLLPLGHGSLEVVAKQLMMSPRKLQYLLAEKNFTFKDIIDQVRIGITQQHLHQSQIPLSQLCEILGYSNQAAFSRAFKRWFGVSPREWKKRHSK